MHSSFQYSDSNQYHLQFPITDFKDVKKKMLNWANRFSIFCFLDNHQYQLEPHSIECILAVGEERSVSGSSLDELQQFIERKQSSLFGHLSYDLKNELEGLTSNHKDHIGFPDYFFFEPSVIIRFNETRGVIEGLNPEVVYDQIMSSDNQFTDERRNIDIKSRFNKKEYIEIIDSVIEHIHRGDCYELNFCQEFFAENTTIDPLHVYLNLSTISPNPFSAFYRVHDRYLICASPERYIRKQGNKVMSQPMKGTSTRYPDDHRKDEQSMNDLSNSSKDRSENVMVVDLVRNDLSRICKEGSVKVDELYGIYSFPQVHQMVSTISGEVKENISFTDMIRATFPMGSMTGAPKRRVMELIEKYERTKRGIFSGAVGYIDPSGNFDFNVVIRSIMYNAATNYISYQVGSGITFYSDPEKEYEECLLKAEAIRRVLE